MPRLMKKIESEKQLELSLKSTVESTMKGFCLKLLSQNIIGLPDRLCLLPGGRVFFVEVKTTGKKPRKIQQYIHEKLRSLGFRVYVLDSSRGINTILRDYGYEIYLDNDEFDYGHNVPSQDPSEGV